MLAGWLETLVLLIALFFRLLMWILYVTQIITVGRHLMITDNVLGARPKALQQL